MALKYRVYKPDKNGRLQRDEKSDSKTLGTGRWEKNYIAQEAKMFPGDVLRIEHEFWLYELDFDGEPSWRVLPTGLELSDVVFGGEAWGPLLIARLEANDG